MLKKHNNDCSTLSAVKNAGKIIVLDHGQVIEQGTHEELLEKNTIPCGMRENKIKCYINLQFYNKCWGRNNIPNIYFLKI